ncbi:hypothetical protein [Flexistipes sp.]|uniref:hypothetical protein n=1 Tax=Flexistipes sp. TaxID=3088135 RepID=UPI002E1A39DE|nr:hypothetical protein [Flexistipes sp.]
MSLVAKSIRDIPNKISKTDKHSINSVKRSIREHFRGIKELSEIKAKAEELYSRSVITREEMQFIIDNPELIGEGGSEIIPYLGFAVKPVKNISASGGSGRDPPDISGTACNSVKNTEKTLTRRHILKTAAAAGIFAVLSPLLSNAASLGDALSKNQKGVYPTTLDYNFVTPDGTPKFGYSEWDRNRMKDQNLPPGIWEMLNREGNKYIIKAFKKHQSYDADLRQINGLEHLASDVQMREPGFWLTFGLINKKTGGADMHYNLNDLQKDERFDELSPSVYYFARGMEDFGTYWIKNKRGKTKGATFKQCKEMELHFLKGLFTSFKYEDKITDYDKLGYYEKRVKQKEIGEKLAKEYQSKDINGREAMIKNIILPKINQLGNSGDDYMRKLWASWNITMNVINYDYTYGYNNGNTEKKEYGGDNSDLMWNKLEEIITPKNGDYILPQIRGPPRYYNKRYYF